MEKLVAEKMIKNAEQKSYEQGIRVLNIIKLNDHLGYSIVKGVTDTYTVSYFKKGNTSFVYECSCPHNTHRGLPCKHMFKVGRQLDKKGINTQLVVVDVEQDQKEKVIDTNTVSIVNLQGFEVNPVFSIDSIVNDLKTVGGATLQGGVIYILIGYLMTMYMMM